MLIMFASIGLLILGIVGLWLYDRTIIFYHDAICIVSFIVIIISIVVVFATTATAISANIHVPLQQAKLDLEYETLLNEVAYVQDLQNEPVSDFARIEYTNVAERVLDWNKRALEAQTLGNSLWTNWFYNDAERSMKLIEY